MRHADHHDDHVRVDELDLDLDHSVNPYDVLGVNEGASSDDVRRAYLALARRHHPDRWADSSPRDRERALRRMQEVNEAWAMVAGPGRPPSPAPEPPPSGFRPFDDSDDDPDPRAAPDIPYPRARAASGSRAAITMAPVGLFAAGVVSGVLGLVLGPTVFWSAAVVLFIVSCLGFVAIPLLVLGEATKDEG